MIGSVGQQAASQGLEMVGLVLAKSQQKQEGQMVMQLLQSAAAAAPAPAPVGSLGNNIDIHV